MLCYVAAFSKTNNRLAVGTGKESSTLKSEVKAFTLANVPLKFEKIAPAHM